MELGVLVEGDRGNAVAGWLLVGAMGATTTAAIGAGDLLWAAFVALAVGVSVAPAVLTRAPLAMPPWEVVAVATLPAAAYVLHPGDPFRQIAVYLAVVALGLLVVAQLHLVGPVTLPPGFAVGFVVLAAMAVAGVLTILRYLSDVYLGTAFLTTADALMWDLTTASAAAVAGGPLFWTYFRRYA